MFGFQNYPTKYKDINLSKIRKIQNLFHSKVFGYADHSAWDEKNNELITLLIASIQMDYIEKHVTTAYGEERCDYSSAISITQLNQLHKKIGVLEKIIGSGSMGLNSAEKKYSLYGPMKMAAMASRDLNIGDELSINDLYFSRTSQVSDISQVEILKAVGKKLIKEVKVNKVLSSNHVLKD